MSLLLSDMLLTPFGSLLEVTLPRTIPEPLLIEKPRGHYLHPPDSALIGI